MRPQLVHVADPACRALAEAALNDIEQRAKPRLAALRRQPIHNDFNLYNLLADPAATHRVAGILDFGDMVEGPLVDETQDALATIAPFAAAYHTVSPLQEVEAALLLDLVRARLAMVVAIGGWRAARQPDNAPYLLRNNAVSWARLAACAALTPEQLQSAIHAAYRTPTPEFLYA